ncbi:phosphatidylcholine:ceramide cholinephosphotransferase 2 [Polyodon spathula]|uniref:phosphatidylcholine:ceramide cholinephosphotransferase 2 n=1 Tax=Polyodon spathula TaxID=7913 RepID=UPI001B7F44DE|nr:phosphatidylcholine:ceramide cholinephosphotransferase 2 [Polyodon spathula]
MASPQLLREVDSVDTQLDVHMEEDVGDLSNGFQRSSPSVNDEGSQSQPKQSNLPNGLRKSGRKHQDYIKISVPEPKNRLPLEWWKTGIAFIYALFNLVLTTVMITVVHERVPAKETSPPLPDKFFDYVGRVEWAFSISEINGMILVGLWCCQWLFLRYKSIAARRFFFIMGTLYLYRCMTMYVTTLPVPGMHMKCAPKLHGDSQAKLQRILRLISGGGLSITGSHILCGDFLYSGHTVMLTLTYLFIKEYSPRRFWWYHLLCWLLSAVGVVCILVGHEHYTVDVVIAYYITTRLFWWYHTMANVQTLRSSPQNYLSRSWWNPVFCFFEKNVQTQVPCSFSWPIAWPPSCFKSSCKNYSMVQSARRQ